MEQIGAELVAIGVMWYLVFLFSTTCHEAAHALAAKLGGDPTAFHGGQVTLNPLPHIEREPIGMIVAPIASLVLSKGGYMVGWASAPYDASWQARHPRRAAWMALAGPAANFTLMLIAAGGIRLGMAMGAFRAPAAANFTKITEAVDPAAMGFAATLVSILFAQNLLLGTFNLLPFPPLDGNTGVTLLMSERVARRFLDFTQDSTFRLVGLLLAWYGFGYVIRYIYVTALNVLYPGAGYG